MIEVSGFIHQLNVSEAQKENDYCQAVFVTQSNEERGNPADQKNQVCIISNRFYPFKTVIAEEKLWLNV